MERLATFLARQLTGAWAVRALHASSFCQTWQATQGTDCLFVKSSPASQSAVLQAEAGGLRALAATQAVRVPQVILCEHDGEVAVLCMEWLQLTAPDSGFGARLGEALGRLHSAPCSLQPPRYGWPSDNFIGATPQCNGLYEDWPTFFAQQRLQAMRARLACEGQHADLCDAIDAVMAALPRFFDDGHGPRPSLIHGDLWSGNWGMLADGTPVIYDPAVSCSDAEAELAMMELFGSPPGGFWPAYQRVARLHPGYARRRPLYQLYHLLNHAVLFGGGYARQALQCARRLA